MYIYTCIGGTGVLERHASLKWNCKDGLSGVRWLRNLNWKYLPYMAQYLHFRILKFAIHMLDRFPL